MEVYVTMTLPLLGAVVGAGVIQAVTPGTLNPVYSQGNR